MIKGLKELKNKISERGFNARVGLAMKKYVKKVVDDAKSKAPTVITFMNGDTANFQSTDVGSSIYGYYRNKQVVLDVADEQAPYIEFGTGIYAARQVGQYEEEWQQIAAQFIVNKKGTLLSSPFMHPAVTENYPMILTELEKELNG